MVGSGVSNESIWGLVMRRLGATCSFVAIMAALLVLFPVARSDANQLGGTLKFNGGFAITNPCDNTMINLASGLQVTGVVSVIGSQVFVSVTFLGTNFMFPDGYTYNMHGQAVAAYNTPVTGGLGGPQGSFYQLPMLIDFDTNSSALDFLAQQNISVVVDGNQKPKGISTTGVSATCGK